jgi:acyl-CoA hydrolase
MNCIFCGKEVNGNRCLSCGMNQDSFIKPVEIKEEVEVITEVIELKPKKKKGK